MAAEYRSVHTEMWRADDWFQTLPTDARLLWIYLFTNPSASVSGIYKLPIRTMANETGLDLTRVTELLAEFREAKKAYYQDGIIWVRKMRDYQLPGKISAQLIAHLNKEIAKIPDGYLKREYLIAYGYRIDTYSKPVDTVSIPRATDTDTDTETDTETETETETETKLKRAQSATAPTYAAFLQARGGSVNPLDGEQVGELEALYGTDATLQAIEYCNSHRKQPFLSIGYIAKTLAGWQKDGAPKSSGNGSKPHEMLTTWQSPDGRERIIGYADGREVRREPWEQ